MSPVLIEGHFAVGLVKSGPKQGTHINLADFCFLNFFQTGVVLFLLPFYFLQLQKLSSFLRMFSFLDLSVGFIVMLFNLLFYSSLASK